MKNFKPDPFLVGITAGGKEKALEALKKLEKQERKTTMTKEQLKEFCLLWGFNLDDPSLMKNSMPYSLFGKMVQDATEKHGSIFADFMRSNTDTSDDYTFVCAYSFDELWEKWQLETNPLLNNRV